MAERRASPREARAQTGPRRARRRTGRVGRAQASFREQQDSGPRTASTTCRKASVGSARPRRDAHDGERCLGSALDVSRANGDEERTQTRFARRSTFATAKSAPRQQIPPEGCFTSLLAWRQAAQTPRHRWRTRRLPNRRWTRHSAPTRRRNAHGSTDDDHAHRVGCALGGLPAPRGDAARRAGGLRGGQGGGGSGGAARRALGDQDPVLAAFRPRPSASLPVPR